MSTDTFDQLPSEDAPLDVPDRVLTVGAHPDDAEFGAGATLARWADAGATITMCILTDGSKGSWDTVESAVDLAERRRVEQRAAADVLGAASVVHCDHVDGELEYTMALRRQVAVEIRRWRPTVVLGHDPWQHYQMHPDHRAAGFAVVDGVVSAREPRAMMDSGLPAHRPKAVLLWSADRPDHSEPIASEWFSRKVDALVCHSSQIETTMGGAGLGAEERDRFVARLREWHIEAGARLGGPPAETFKRLTP